MKQLNDSALELLAGIEANLDKSGRLDQRSGYVCDQCCDTGIASGDGLMEHHAEHGTVNIGRSCSCPKGQDLKRARWDAEQKRQTGRAA